MQTVSRSTFTTVTTEGAILPADLLQRIMDGRELEGLRPTDYHLAPNERLNEAINRSWNRLTGVWESFQEQREMLPDDDRGTTLTRERWLLILFDELGYGRLPYKGGLGIGEQGSDGDPVTYPISHLWDRFPIHLVSFRQSLEKPDTTQGERFRRSPHSLLQEFLNRSEDSLWGLVANGLRLRILRDNASFTRAAYLEFDLEAMMEGEIYADFTLLWLVAHQSRVEGDPASCWLEKWSQEAAAQGTRALDSLRDGVAEAIALLGRGFLAHPGNRALKEELRSGALSTQDYYRQLLRLVYRLIFLFVAEDRNLLLVGSEAVGSEGVGDSRTPSLPHSPTPSIRQRYYDYYGVSRLRTLAARRRTGPHPDLYRSLRLVVALLRDGYPALGLPALGSYLFSARSTPSLDEAEMANEALLDAIRALTFTTQDGVRRPVDYKNLGAEELGSVYESLLELHPDVNATAATFELRTAAGSERKTTGSYYTPTSLITSLLDTALEPVVKDRLEAARRKWKEGSKGIGSKGVRDERDSVVSGSEGLAGGDDASGDVLPGDAGLSGGGAIRADVTDSESGSVGAGEHSRGLRPGEPAGLHSLSAHRSGLSEGTGDPSDPGNTGEHGEPSRHPTGPGRVQDSRRDAAFADSGVGEEGSAGIGSKGVGGSLPHSPTASLPQLLEEALLDIKVVDPAAGSGHFLIAAANRLARHLARIRTGDEEPDPAASRDALRDVVRRCIHGVDINEMAVELCKVGLWLETLDPGRPLSFLDANIQCGNSLIGATPELLEEGIPDDAFTPITGDDKAYVREFKKANREQRKGQRSLFKGQSLMPWDRLGNLAAAMQRLDALDDETVDGVRAQEEAYAEHVRGQDYEYGKLWADAWCAAFVWVKRGESSPTPSPPHSPTPSPSGFPYPITEEESRAIEHSPHRVPQWMKDEIRRLAAQYQFFHWHLAFPHVFRPAEPQSPAADPSSGFDVVLGNPPWERVKLQEKEWFATRSPEIANARNKAAREKLIKKLKAEDPALLSAFYEARRQAEGESLFARNSGRYPLTGRGDVNTYALFAGLVRQVLSPIGRVGVILPTGIATDYHTQYYFQDLVDNAALVSLFDFENRQKIFPGIDSRMKFSLLTLTGSDWPAAAFEFLFFAQDAVDLRDEQKHFSLTPLEIRLINPNTRTVPIFRGQHDAELTKAIYRRVPVLINDGPPERNPWGMQFLRMFDMSADSHLFRIREDLEEETWRMVGNRFVSRSKRDGMTHEEVFLPLYEAKMLHHYDHRWATYEGLEPRNVTAGEHDDPLFAARPRYWVAAEEVDERLSARPKTNWLFAWRDFTNATNERTLISTSIPRNACGDTVLLMFPDIEFSSVSPLIPSNLDSFAADYVSRQKIGGTHMKYHTFKQLPIFPPETYLQLCLWSSHKSPCKLREWLMTRILELAYTAYDLHPFGQDLGYHGPPFRWDEERRFLLRCELDAAYFHLYGIERDDVAYIMDTFPIVRRKDEAAYGEYRTKRVILEIYDEMGSAIRNQGSAYQSRLDPPPAHPDAAHPWDEAYLGPELPREEWWQEASQPAPAPAPTKTVKEPGPSFTLKPPQPRPKPSTPDRPAQAPLIADFTPPEGSRSQRLKRVMDLGRLRTPTNIHTLAASLGDKDANVRWLAGSHLVRFGGRETVETLAAYLASDPPEVGRAEALRVLGLIADADEDEAVRGMASEVLGQGNSGQEK